MLPYDELPMSKWNGNPYNLDGGNEGRSEDDGAYYLLPGTGRPVPPADYGVASMLSGPLVSALQSTQRA